MRKIIVLFILFAFMLQSCGESCGECFTPPQNFMFEIVDKESGANLFTNGTYMSSQIQMTNTLNDSPVEFTFINENNNNLISIDGIGWKTEIVNLKVDIANNQLFKLYVDAERKSADCCNFTKYNEINLSECEFELDSQTGIYKILVE